MRLYKRGDIYYAEFGRGKSRSLKTADKKEALSIYRELEREWLHGRLRSIESGSSKTLSDFKTEYMRARMSLSSNTIKMDEVSLAKLAEVIGWTHPIGTITTRDIDEFKSACLARGVKAVSCNSWLRHVKSALAKAHEWGLLKDLPSMKLLRVGRQLPRFLSKGEIDAILFQAGKYRPEFRAMLVVYLWTGARRNELLYLKWSDCHLDGDSPYLLLKGKGDRERTVPVLPAVREALSPAGKEGYVFQRMHPTTVSCLFKKIARDCGIEDIHLHHLRHTAATYMLASGIPMRVVQEILGHASITTTGIYGHVIRERLGEEMAKLRFE